MTRRPIALAGCFVGALDHPTRGRTLLYPWQPVDLLDVVAPHQAYDRAHARHRRQPPKRFGVMRRRRGHDLGLEVLEESSRGVESGESDVAVVLDRWLGTAWGDPLTRRFGLTRLPSRRPMVLAVRLAHRGQPLRPLAPQMPAPPPQVAGGTPGGRIR